MKRTKVKNRRSNGQGEASEVLAMPLGGDSVIVEEELVPSEGEEELTPEEQLDIIKRRKAEHQIMLRR